MLSELIEEIEERLRLIIREEIQKALSEINNPTAKFDFQKKQEIEPVTEKIKPSANKDFPQLLTAADVAKILCVSVPRVYELARARKTNGFPVIVLGERQYRFSREAILDWIKREHK
jgi:excisionase family DNA binding protein